MSHCEIPRCRPIPAAQTIATTKATSETARSATKPAPPWTSSPASGTSTEIADVNPCVGASPGWWVRPIPSAAFRA